MMTCGSASLFFTQAIPWWKQPKTRYILVQFWAKKTPNSEKQTNIVVVKCGHQILIALLLAYSDLSFLIASCYLETLQIRPPMNVLEACQGNGSFDSNIPKILIFETQSEPATEIDQSFGWLYSSLLELWPWFKMRGKCGQSSNCV